MTWRSMTTATLVAGPLLVSLSGGGACSRNPAPATPAPSTSRSTSDGQRPTMGGPMMFGLYFDPQGADFTLWINHFKNELYRNWSERGAAIPDSIRGHVDFEFIIERNGSMSALRMLKSSGISSLDQAAREVLSASAFNELPNDYKPPRVTMQVTCFYNEAPR